MFIRRGFFELILNKSQMNLWTWRISIFNLLTCVEWYSSRKIVDWFFCFWSHTRRRGWYENRRLIKQMDCTAGQRPADFRLNLISTEGKSIIVEEIINNPLSFVFKISVQRAYNKNDYYMDAVDSTLPRYTHHSYHSFCSKFNNLRNKR